MRFRGTFPSRRLPFSAKKVAGRRAYERRTASRLQSNLQPVRGDRSIELDDLLSCWTGETGAPPARCAAPASTCGRWRTTWAGARLRRAPRGCGGPGPGGSRSRRRSRSRSSSRAGSDGSGRLVRLNALLAGCPRPAVRGWDRRVEHGNVVRPRTRARGERPPGSTTSVLDGSGRARRSRRTACPTALCIPSCPGVKY